MSLRNKSILLTLGILFLDQFSKIWIKTHFYLGEEHNIIGDWFRIHFIENNGMAYGIEFGGNYGKLFLSVFRIIAIAFIIWYITKLIKNNAPTGVILGFSGILAGAAGNVFDSAFYGLIFGESSWRTVAEFLPQGGGYAGFLFGKVVDMLYFPVINGYIPDWSPISPGEHFVFFSPIFNISDAAITVSVFYMLIFQRNFFKSM